MKGIRCLLVQVVGEQSNEEVMCGVRDVLERRKKGNRKGRSGKEGIERTGARRGGFYLFPKWMATSEKGKKKRKGKRQERKTQIPLCSITRIHQRISTIPPHSLLQQRETLLFAPQTSLAVGSIPTCPYCILASFYLFVCLLASCKFHSNIDTRRRPLFP